MNKQNSSESGGKNYRECPYCGQNQIPFKKGVCVCGRQVGSIRYVNDAKKFAKSYYKYLGCMV